MNDATERARALIKTTLNTSGYVIADEVLNALASSPGLLVDLALEADELERTNWYDEEPLPGAPATELYRRKEKP